MQWNADRKRRFSRANPQQLYLPIVLDPGYHAEAVNVEAAEATRNSLLVVDAADDPSAPALQGVQRGTLEHLRPETARCSAFLRRHDDELILVVVNLSRFVQCAELDLSEAYGRCRSRCSATRSSPRIGVPALLHHPRTGYGFCWFSSGKLDTASRRGPDASLTCSVGGTRCSPSRGSSGRSSPPGCRRRWFTSKTRTIHGVSVPRQHPGGRPEQSVAHMAIVRVELDQGGPSTTNSRWPTPVPNGRRGSGAGTPRRWWPTSGSVTRTGSCSGRHLGARGGESGARHDRPATVAAVAAQAGVWGAPTPSYRAIRRDIPSDVQPVPVVGGAGRTRR